MTAIDSQGFEVLNSIVSLENYYGVTLNASMSTGRVVGNSLLWAYHASNNNIPFNVPDNNAWVVGFGYKLTDIPAEPDYEATILEFTLNGTVSTKILISTNFAAGTFFFKVVNAVGTVLGNSLSITMDVWHYIEIKVIITSNTSFGLVHIRANETAIVTLNNKNTDPNDQLLNNRIKLYSGLGAGGQASYMDDIYIITHGQGANNNDWLGNSIIEGVIPSSTKATGGNPGSEQTWAPSTGTNHEAMVDESGMHDGDGTYVSAQAANLTEIFSVTDLTTITGNILFTKQIMFGRVTSAGTRNIRGVYKDPGGEKVYNADMVLSSTTYVPLNIIREKFEGGTPRAFLVDDINNGEWGFETRP